jgi:hypothetical protein
MAAKATCLTDGRATPRLLHLSPDELPDKLVEM